MECLTFLMIKISYYMIRVIFFNYFATCFYKIECILYNICVPMTPIVTSRPSTNNCIIWWCHQSGYAWYFYEILNSWNKILVFVLQKYLFFLFFPWGHSFNLFLIIRFFSKIKYLLSKMNLSQNSPRQIYNQVNVTL